MTRDTIAILGIPIDNLTENEAIHCIAHFLEQGGPHQVVTTNPEFIMEAQHNTVFRTVLLQADLSVPDGFGLILASHWLGCPLRERVTGVGLTNRIAALAAQHGYRLFLLGAAPGVAEEAAHLLVQRYPGLCIAGCFAGSPSPRHEPFLRQIITAAHPDILLVAYGHPKQDVWIARNQPFLDIPVAMGVGGVYDYLTGRVPFAPAWVRGIGMEWFYRLLHQPRRWKRILVAVPLFAWAVITHSRRYGILGMPK